MPLPRNTEPVERRSARDSVYERLKSWIEDGVLAPGEVIRDVTIARHLDVSRTPVREALQTLEQQGIVESVPGRYTRVAGIAPEDADHVYPPLAALEALAAELAVGRLSAADFRQLEKINEELLAAARSGDAVAARDADTAFHMLLVERTENRYLTAAIEPLLMHVRRLEAIYFKQFGPAESSYDEHQLIIEALRSEDVGRVSALVRTNFGRYVRDDGHAPA